MLKTINLIKINTIKNFGLIIDQINKSKLIKIKYLALLSKKLLKEI